MHTMFVFTRLNRLSQNIAHFFSSPIINTFFFHKLTHFTNIWQFLHMFIIIILYTLCGFSVAHQASPDMEHGFHSSHSRTTSKFISMQCCIIYIRPRIKLYFKLMHTYHISPFPLLSTLPLSTPFSLFT